MEDRFGAPALSTDDSTRDSSADTARDSGQRIADSAHQAVGAVKDAAKDIAGSARDMAKDAAGIARDQAGDAAAALKEKVRTATDGIRQDAAGQASTASSTLRRSAEGLDQELPWMRSALDKAADGIDHLSSALQKGDVNETLHHVTEFARRQPALFMGLSVAVGFALARVGKTAIERAVPETTAAANGADTIQPQNAGV
jgi:uncharacterized protein YjbJ (UPF0337 family)